MGMYVSEAGKHPAGPGDPESGVHAAPDDNKMPADARRKEMMRSFAEEEICRKKIR